MSKYIPGNQKHLSLDDRKFIQKALDEGQSFKDIARFLCKDPTTISKEVKKHRLDDWYSKGRFITLTTTVYIGTTAKRQMLVTTSSYVA